MAKGWNIKISLRRGWAWPIVIASKVSKRLAYRMLYFALKVEQL